MSTTVPSRSPFLRIALGTLASLCLAGAANQVHIHRLKGELQAVADEKLAEFRAESFPENGKPARIGAGVAVAKPFVFWGVPTGKVSVFLEHGDVIEGFEYFFMRMAPMDWTQTESGRCSSEECTVEGKKLLDALGEKF